MGIGNQPWQIATRRGAYHALLVFAATALLFLEATGDWEGSLIRGGLAALAMLTSRAGIEGWVVDQRAANKVSRSVK